jgi:hypothetical protein
MGSAVIRARGPGWVRLPVARITRGGIGRWGGGGSCGQLKTRISSKSWASHSVQTSSEGKIMSVWAATSSYQLQMTPVTRTVPGAGGAPEKS